MIVGQRPDGMYIVDRDAATNFDEASDADQSKYFDIAYNVLEANPDLKILYEREPQSRLSEELWDIDHKNPESRYNTLRYFINKNKFNIPVDRYTGKPETDYLANVLTLIKDKKPESSSPEQIQDLEKEFGTQGDNSDTGTSYQSREEVPESARDLWDIMHNDEAINSMRRGM